MSNTDLEPVSVRVVPREDGGALAIPREARTAMLAAAGGVLAGAATVAAVRAVSAAGSRPARRRLFGRRGQKVVASRSFLVDVHLLGR